MKKYYAVYGKNGLGVFTDYSAVLIAKEFLSHFNCKKCDVRHEAETLAITKYNELQDYPGGKRFSVSRVKNNWVYYTNQMNDIIVPIIKKTMN